MRQSAAQNWAAKCRGTHTCRTLNGHGKNGEKGGKAGFFVHPNDSKSGKEARVGNPRLGKRKDEKSSALGSIARKGFGRDNGQRVKKNDEAKVAGLPARPSGKWAAGANCGLRVRETGGGGSVLGGVHSPENCCRGLELFFGENACFCLVFWPKLLGFWAFAWSCCLPKLGGIEAVFAPLPCRNGHSVSQ